ncbi:MAG: hypothetical protein DMD83_15195 [Candidatus Rokuibacteriota bacterium]|nr:MAG: hypothetical protein DMD83_15195 [Candidatus Rokubacteria bacterium]
MAEEETFKVTDRRGRAREAGGAEPDAPRSAEPRPESPPRAEPTDRPGTSAAAEPGGPDLQGLFMMIARSALINLGEAADPVTRERRVDLEQAREAIDVLLLLRDKTSGNRTEPESRLLEEIVYDLQMRFVRAAEAGRPR